MINLNSAIIEGLLPDDGGGLMLIAGRTGIGKTNLALQLGFCLATGTPFLGFPCQKVVVGYLGFEGSVEGMKERLSKIEVSFPDTSDDNFRFDLRAPFKLDRGMAEFIEMLKGLDVIIIDPVKYLVPGDYCKPVDANNFLAMLVHLLKGQGVVAVLCQHVRKPNPNIFLNPGDVFELKGAADYAEAATTVLMLEKQRQSKDREGHFLPASIDRAVLYFSKTRDSALALPPIHLIFDRERLLFIPSTT